MRCLAAWQSIGRWIWLQAQHTVYTWLWCPNIPQLKAFLGTPWAPDGSEELSFCRAIVCLWSAGRMSHKWLQDEWLDCSPANLGSQKPCRAGWGVKEAQINFQTLRIQVLSSCQKFSQRQAYLSRAVWFAVCEHWDSGTMFTPRVIAYSVESLLSSAGGCQWKTNFCNLVSDSHNNCHILRPMLWHCALSLRALVIPLWFQLLAHAPGNTVEHFPSAWALWTVWEMRVLPNTEEITL